MVNFVKESWFLRREINSVLKWKLKILREIKKNLREIKDFLKEI